MTAVPKLISARNQYRHCGDGSEVLPLYPTS